MTELQRLEDAKHHSRPLGGNGGSLRNDKGNTMNWKKLSFLLALTFLISAGSSLITWYILSRQQKVSQDSWKEMLNLTPDQEKKFSALEAEFNLAMKDISVQDAQNKIFLSSYLGDDMQKPEIKSAAQKMAWVYQKKQEKIATTLASIAAILTPDQRRKFSQRLMHEICVSCRKTMDTVQCLCGMCNAKHG
jgi:hypothetical protein